MKNKKRRSVQIFVSDQIDRPSSQKKQAKPNRVLPNQSPRFAFAKPPIKINLWVTDAKQAVRSARWGARLFWLTAIVTILLLLSGSWLAARLVVNPGGWLRGVLPEWNQSLGLQTLGEIRAEAAQRGQMVGEAIDLAKGKVLLPIVAQSAYCQDACLQIVELRAYQSAQNQLSQKRFELIDHLTTPGVEELMAIAPLTHFKITSAGSSRKLPLTTIAALDGKAPDAGVWLCLSGSWQRSSTQTLFGQIVRYDPIRDRLQPLLTWTSPAVEQPHWQQLTGSATPELVVNQTIGLEPQFQVYQVKAPNAPGQPVQLEAITLTEPALDNSIYENGLLLARNGLWSEALKYFRRVNEAGNGSARSQAQMALVALHAQQTQRQADRTWASPTQQITALLIDGRWAQAFDRLKVAHTEGYDIKNLLAANADSFWQRITAALRVNPNQPHVQRWGALVKAAKHDRPTAIAWLKQTRSSLSAQQTQSLFALLDSASIDPSLSIPPTSPATPRLIGSATRINRPDLAAWFAPRSIPRADATWYEIEVLGFQQGQQWQQPAAAKASSAGELQTLWEQLGLDADTQVQLIAWSEGESQTIAATVQAIQTQAGRLRLLAIAAPTQPVRTALAFTPNSLHWLSPLTTLTLATLQQQQPEQTAAFIKTLETELGKIGQGLPVSTAASAASDASSPDLSQWSIDQMELTGDAQPETVLALKTDQPGVVDARTLIFSAAGGLLYSDLQATGQAVVGIVDVGSTNNAHPVLILRSAQGYQMLQWSGSKFR
ncbi:hypothetical protein IFO70_18830 [Phormidium tenue FACHB-886]|nr:hypothetical protein [Phormidium tenue FACHB-886]